MDALGPGPRRALDLGALDVGPDEAPSSFSGMIPYPDPRPGLSGDVNRGSRMPRGFRAMGIGIGWSRRGGDHRLLGFSGIGRRGQRGR